MMTLVFNGKRGKYGIVENLGCGSFSTVYSGTKIQKECDKVAIKVIKQKLKRSFDNELKLLKSFSCKKIVTLIDCDEEQCALVLELMDSTMCNPHFQSFTPFEKAGMLMQLLSALSYLVEKNIVHRDIKPANVLVRYLNQDEHSVEVKLADFGSAAEIKSGKQKNQVTTIPYLVAEQAFSSEENDFIGPEIDIWSFGCTAAELFSGKPLFTAKKIKPDLQNQIIDKLGAHVDYVQKQRGDDVDNDKVITLPEGCPEGFQEYWWLITDTVAYKTNRAPVEVVRDRLGSLLESRKVNLSVCTSGEAGSKAPCGVLAEALEEVDAEFPRLPWIDKRSQIIEEIKRENYELRNACESQAAVGTCTFEAIGDNLCKASFETTSHMIPFRAHNQICIKSNGNEWKGVVTCVDEGLDLTTVTAHVDEPYIGISLPINAEVRKIYDDSNYRRRLDAIETLSSSTNPIVQILLGAKQCPNASKESFYPFEGPVQKILSLNSLNNDQLEAVKSAARPGVSYIAGYPGAGKTRVATVLAHVLSVASATGQITVHSETNESVELLTNRLAEVTTGWKPGDIIFIPARSREDSTTCPYALHAVMSSIMNDSTEEDWAELNALKAGGKSQKSEFDKKYRLMEDRLLRKARVVCTTFGVLGDARLASVKRKYVIVDEAGKVPMVDVLRAVSPVTTHLTLIGDKLQLKPRAGCNTTEGTSSYKQLNRSVIEDLEENGLVPIAKLVSTFRMREEIAKLANHLTYNGEIQVQPRSTPQLSWAAKSPFPGADGLFFINNREGKQEKLAGSTSQCNRLEAQIIAQLCQKIMSTSGAEQKDIMVLSHYTAQVLMIRHYLGEKQLSEVRVLTGSACQGTEAEVVIISMVITDRHTKFSSDPNLNNVMMTRPKEQLYMVGNFKALLASNIDTKSLLPKLCDELVEIGAVLDLNWPHTTDGTISLHKSAYNTVKGVNEKCKPMERWMIPQFCFQELKDKASEESALCKCDRAASDRVHLDMAPFSECIVTAYIESKKSAANEQECTALRNYFHSNGKGAQYLYPAVGYLPGDTSLVQAVMDLHLGEREKATEKTEKRKLDRSFPKDSDKKKKQKL